MQGIFGTSLAELIGAAARRKTGVPPELAAFVALEVAEGLAGKPSVVETTDVMITDDGQIAVVPKAAAAPEAQAARAVGAILARILMGGTSVVPPALNALVNRATDAQRGYGDLANLRKDLEAVLIPLNRGAARRVLARFVREVLRQPTPVMAAKPLPLDPTEAGTDAVDELLSALDQGPEKTGVMSPAEIPAVRAALSATSAAPVAPQPGRPIPPAPQRPGAPPRAVVPEEDLPTRLAPAPAIPAGQRERMNTAMMFGVTSEPPPARADDSAPEISGSQILEEASSKRTPSAIPLPSFKSPASPPRAAIVPEVPAPPPGLQMAAPAPPITFDLDALLPPEGLQLAAPQAPIGFDQAGLDGALESAGPPAGLVMAAPQDPVGIDAILGDAEGSRADAILAELEKAANGGAAPPAAPSAATEGDERRRKPSFVPPAAVLPQDVVVPSLPERKRSAGPLIFISVLVVGLALGAIGVVKPELLGLRGAGARERETTPARRPQDRPIPVTGTLSVSSNPPGAEVFLLAGEGPVDVQPLAAGAAYEFLAMHDGHAPARARILANTVWQDQPASSGNVTKRIELAMQLEPVAAGLPASEIPPSTLAAQQAPAGDAPRGLAHVVTNPMGASVFLRLGITPTGSMRDVPISDRMQLLVTLPGHQPFIETLRRSDFALPTGALSLEKAVTLVPAAAEGALPAAGAAGSGTAVQPAAPASVMAPPSIVPDTPGPATSAPQAVVPPSTVPAPTEARTPQAAPAAEPQRPRRPRVPRQPREKALPRNPYD